MSEAENSIMQRVVKFFRDDDWNFQLDDNVLSARIRCNNATYTIFAFVSEQNSTIRILSTIDTKILGSKRTAIAEYLTRVNCGLPVGNFEFDIDSGEINYKTSIDVEGSVEFLTNNVIDNLITANYVTMDQYYPGIMRINYSNDNIDIKEVVWEIEKQRSSS